MNSTIKVLLRTDSKLKDEKYPIYLRVTINRKVRQYSLKIATTENDWDDTKKRIKRSDPWHAKNNLIIENSFNKANDILYNAKLNNKSISFREFKGLFYGEEVNNDCFYTFATNAIESQRGVYSIDTIKTQLTQISKLKKFRPKLYFCDVNLDFLHNYKKHMVSVLKNNENTCNKSLSWIRSIMIKAIKNGKIRENPFKNFALKKVTGNRNFLTIVELRKIEKLQAKKLPGNLKHVLKCFLFCCYTGLRYRDVKELRHCDINDNIIKITMHKTKDTVTIPLHTKALALIEKGFDKQKIFKVYTNQVMNRYLQKILGKAKITKEISFHCARHTFATIALSVLGMPMEIVSKLLGHKDLQTTQIYAKILDDVKIREMGKWDTLS